ncbi:hypothetical protein Lfu02_15010 [Longispora fulva]|uniref:Bacterial mobilisation domain-containing protein n=1 Tax=Longispora fulva TaxID=619741 RepID=A0A8J7GWZ0_9ACTN|nr:plasmid mobilization relaxosome protein MobC [Longispora fulva]MBG6140489.1 hypothetical protein [Longispora fulva]GIG57129.1 hypothetical protein Lfu02_15010 [Longispora fulva]
MADQPEEDAPNNHAIYLRHRRHRPPGKGRMHDPGGRTVNLALDGKEYAAVLAAAKRAKLRPTSWVAAVAVSFAQDTTPPMPSPGKDLLGELNQARTQLGRYGNNVNQAVKQLHATGEAPPWLTDAVRTCQNTIALIDQLVDELRRRVR